MALDAYQLNLGHAQYVEANQQIPYWETGAASTSPSDDTSVSAPNAGYLQLTIRILSSSNEEADQYAAALTQAQQLVTSFKDQTLTSTSSDATGFSYASVANGDAEGFTITGVKVNSSQVLGYGMRPMPDLSSMDLSPAERDLFSQSTGIVEGGGGFTLAIPIAS